MSQAARRWRSAPLALVLALAGAWTTTGTLSAEAAFQSAITVRVYQSADLPPETERRALVEAATVLRGALVDVRWQRCPASNRARVCDTTPTPDVLLLRFLGEGPRAPRMPLGTAMVAPCAGGVLATVYSNRVANLAEEGAADFAVLLGRVAAHELGHLMMHGAAHSRRGLMRPNWTAGEVRRDRASDWAFTREDVTAMRRSGLE